MSIRARRTRAVGTLCRWGTLCLTGFLCLPVTLAAAPRARPAPPPGGPSPPNILVVLADDVGVDMLAAYGLGQDLPSLPNIDALAAAGTTFRRVWSQPICGPTRATIMTGRHAFRTGMGDQVSVLSPPIQPAEITLPEMLETGTAGTWAHAAFGKWHLALDPYAGPASPNAMGWEHFAGTDGNLYPPHILDPPPYDYFFYEKIEDGVASEVNGYATTDTVDWFLDWAGARTQPWVAYVAFHSAHAPWHVPPDGLYTVDLSTAPPVGEDPRPYYKAMLEAMDHEIGRMLDGLGAWREDTLVVFLGDNGSPYPIPVDPFHPSKAKTTLYEGGVNVPMIVAGKGVAEPGSQCNALVNTTDLYATVAELAGVDLAALLPKGWKTDSISFAPYLANPGLPSARKAAYAECFSPNGPGPYTFWDQAVRNDRFKLIRRSTGIQELYDLLLDPFETANLLLGPLNELQIRQHRLLVNTLDTLVDYPYDTSIGSAPR